MVASIRSFSILLNVHDCQISLDFYQRVLGLTLTESWAHQGRVRWCSLDCAGVTLMLNEHRASGTLRHLGSDHQDCVLYLSVANLSEMRLHLMTEGFAATHPQPQEYGLLQCSVVDPDGYEIALTEPLSVTNQ